MNLDTFRQFQLDLLHWFPFSFSISIQIRFPHTAGESVCNGNLQQMPQKCFAMGGRMSESVRAFRLSLIIEMDGHRQEIAEWGGWWERERKKLVLIGKCKQWQWAIALTIIRLCCIVVHCMRIRCRVYTQIGVRLKLAFAVGAGVKWFSWQWTPSVFFRQTRRAEDVERTKEKEKKEKESEGSQ